MSYELHNADSYEYIKKIPDKSIDLIYIDIPYLFNNGGSGHSELSKRIHKKKDYLSKIDNGINFSIFEDLVRIMKKIHIYIWCSKLQLNDIMNYFLKKDVNFELLVWCKTNPSPSTNNTWLPDIEYCLYFREKGCKLNDGYNLKSKWYLSEINKADKDLFDHPTIKPLELVKRHILHSTQPNDVVLDCFMGSGTTGVACVETNRNFIGIEIDTHYFQIAENRLKGYSQRDIERKEKGQIDLFDLI